MYIVQLLIRKHFLSLLTYTAEVWLWETKNLIVSSALNFAKWDMWYLVLNTDLFPKSRFLISLPEQL